MWQKSSWDKFRGERLCELIVTLGGAGELIIGVTTLESNCALVVSWALIIICDLVWHRWGMGEAKIGLDDPAGIVRSGAVAGTFGSPGIWPFWNLFLKFSASFVRADMYSSPMCNNGTSGWGFYNAFDMLLAAMINLSMEDNCGIGELWEKNRVYLWFVH
jgi:hypothetical protein